MKKSLILLFLCFSLMMGCLSYEIGKDSALNQKDLMLSYRTLFKSGAEGYLSYRKPVLIKAGETLFAFAEGRKNGFFESGDIDIVFKKSTDGGKSWSKLAVAFDDGKNACTRPCLGVIALPSGEVRILLAFTWNWGSDYENEIIEGKGKETSKIFLISSDDIALTWSEKKELSAQVKKNEWNWVATVPAQMLFSSKDTTLMLPCQHYDQSISGYRSHLALSTDFGDSWKIGAISEDGTGELQLAQNNEEVLVAGLRTYAAFHPTTSQKIFFSEDRGKSFIPEKGGEPLIASGCQNSIVFDSVRNRFFFCNPADTKRQKLTLKKGMLLCGGKTKNEKGVSLQKSEYLFNWEELLVIWKDAAAYSSMLLEKDSLWVLFEAGENLPYERILLTQIASPILDNLPLE